MPTNFSNKAGIGVKAPENASAARNAHNARSFKHITLRKAGILSVVVVLSGCAYHCPEGNGKNYLQLSTGSTAPVAKNFKVLRRKRHPSHRHYQRKSKPKFSASKMILDLYLSKPEEDRP